MSKKTAIIILAILIILIGGGLFAWYYFSSKTPAPNDNVSAPNNIFPEGSNSNNNSSNNNQNTNQNQNNPTVTTNEGNQPALKELSVRPSAGAIAISTTTNRVLVRFIEKSSGNIFEVSPENNDENRLTNRTIPRLEESVWHKDGERVIARYADTDGDTIKSYSAQIVSRTTENADDTLSGSFLNENIRSIVSNPDQNKIFYLLSNSAGSTGVIADFDGSKKVQIFSSVASEWLAQWPTKELITVTTKPSNGVVGYMFTINTKNGNLTNVISNVKGLTTNTNPTGELVAYSQNDSDGLIFKIYSFKTGDVIDTTVSTLPEKCVWSRIDSSILYCSVPSYLPPSDYPDSWYKGQVSFSDEIWKIDSDTGAGELLSRLKDSGQKDIDAINLSLSPKEDYIIFTNKKDFHVWSLKI